MNKQVATITQEQIRNALRQFQRAGGTITHFPAQVTPRLSLVRSRSDSFVSWTAAVPPVSGEAALPPTD